MKILIPLLSIFVIFSSCSLKKWVFLNEKKFCVQECTNFYDEIPVNETAYFDEDKLDYCSPFIFKADSIIYQKDTVFNFIRNIQLQKLLIKTKFKFHEFVGFAGSYAGVSKNKISFPIYISNKIDSTIHKKLRTWIITEQKAPFIEVISKGSNRFFKIYEKDWDIYILKNYALFINSKNLPYRENGAIGCGITGGRMSFYLEGLTIFEPLSKLYLKASQFQNAVLNKEDVLKLYK
ncbi:hypothetical protein [Aureispira sp. CCB-E]|uniref:hypothetical protein n=1 Tax=Aureispira sp. CCB-E TaxID=3051121 RepID=UPI00286846B7|nr:hypothetical protein [Aureispira sp. CCB-E]WMX12369.1 hypothetical protein QP953_16185 [Aureispira sp. CCB-E]